MSLANSLQVTTASCSGASLLLPVAKHTPIATSFPVTTRNKGTCQSNYCHLDVSLLHKWIIKQNIKEFAINKYFDISASTQISIGILKVDCLNIIDVLKTLWIKGKVNMSKISLWNSQRTNQISKEIKMTRDDKVGL